jgi:glycosyltransferase involved in cell wall biosynthesis
VVHASFFLDPLGRDGETLLREWPTLHAVSAAVARAGVEVTVVQAAACDEAVVRDDIRYYFVAENNVSGEGRRRRVVPRRLVDVIVSLSPDVVHVHGLQQPAGIWHLVRAMRQTPILVQDHATRAPSGWRGIAWRVACRGIAGVVFTSRAIAVPFLDAGIFAPRLPVFEIPESSSDFTVGDQAAARAATGLHGDPCFLWTGHLNANKDPMTMLAAFARAVSELPDAQLWCCFGNPTLLSVVGEYIRTNDSLRGRVTLLGWRPHTELEQLFRAADFFVQTSHFESTGYSLIEALACGTPGLVTDIPASRRIIGDSAAGSTTPVGDAPALAAAMVEWAGRDPVERRRAARARFEEALSFERIGGDLRAAYESLLVH